MNYLKKSKLKNFVFILINDFSLIAFSNAIEPLRLANRLAQKQLYSWKITSETGEKVNVHLDLLKLIIQFSNKMMILLYYVLDKILRKIQQKNYLIGLEKNLGKKFI